MCGHWSQAPCTQPISNQETRCQARCRLVRSIPEPVEPSQNQSWIPDPRLLVAPALGISPPVVAPHGRLTVLNARFSFHASVFQQLLLRSCQSVSSSNLGMLVPVVCLAYVSKQAEPNLRRGASHSLHGEDRGVVSCVWAAFGFRPCRHRLLVVCPSVRAQGSSNRVMRLRFSSASVLYVLVCRRCSGARLSKIVLINYYR